MTVDNEEHFIAPPPGITPPVAGDEKPTAAPIATENLIDLPPGIVDSGTYRIATPRSPKPEGVDDAPAFFPVAAPGLPPQVPTDEQRVADPETPDVAGAAPITEPTPTVSTAPEAVDDATRVSIGRRGTPQWRLTLPDGQEVSAHNTILLGRDPAPAAAWPEATLLAVDDVAKSVSKTHAALELTAGGQLVVHDLNSTNGVFVQHPGSAEIVVEPGHPELVEPGTLLGFGEFSIAIRRD
tara:strand:- start:1718 stop:2434 length:717 start_codon:yes stop_codon:yes gene_type:complete